MSDKIANFADAVAQWPPEFAVLGMAILAVILALYLAISLVHLLFKRGS